MNLKKTKITSIEYSAKEKCYDLSMQDQDFSNYITGEGFVSHNSRPGPLHSGQSEMVTRAKREGNNKEWDVGVDEVNNALMDITSGTYGYMVFQEQIMRTMREVGNMDWQTVARVRNAMSKSYGDEYFDQFRKFFADGANEIYGLSPDMADEIFNHASHFGSWAFNLAHSVGYSVISYVSAYFKAYHPREFYQALCNHNDGDKLKALLREYIQKDLGKILPPKIGKSQFGWTIDGNDLRAGLKDTLSEAACIEILSLYPIEDADDLLKRAQRRKVNKTVWKKIDEHQLFSEDDDIDPFGLYVFAERMSHVRDRKNKIGELGYSFNFRDVTIAGVMDRQINEKSLTELQASTKLKDWKKRFDAEAGDLWCILYLVDETGGPINIHVKNDTYPKYRDYLWRKKPEEDILVIKGIIPPNMNYVIAKQIWDADNAKAAKAQCFKCPLVDQPFVAPCGDDSAKIMIIGMSPGKDEVKLGYPFAGQAGKVLDGCLQSSDLSRNDLWITNSCLCRSADENGNNRDPSDIEISCCNERLRQEIVAVQPSCIVTLGKLAYKALTGKEVAISSVEGERIMWGDFSVIPSFHPAACLYGGGESKKGRITKVLKYAKEIANQE